MKKRLSRAWAVCVFATFAIAAVAAPVFAAAKAAPSKQINLNSASVQQLAQLPGVGEKLAARIIEYRQKAGGFKSTRELLNVKGIGEKSFVKIQPLVTLTGSDAKTGTAK